jgi:hypothetical protein
MEERERERPMLLLLLHYGCITSSKLHRAMIQASKNETIFLLALPSSYFPMRVYVIILFNGWDYSTTTTTFETNDNDAIYVTLRSTTT